MHPAETGVQEGTGSVSVLRPGLLASVQDLGRYGHRERGICPGGALDSLALSLANWLVGNSDDEAGLEITLGGCELRFDAATRIAIAGDDFGARLDGVPVWPYWSFPVQPGQVLKLGGVNQWQPKKGMRSWLAIAGGIDVPVVLGSRSTDLKAGFGGHLGRALKRGDELPLGATRLDEKRLGRRPFGIRSPAEVEAGQQAAPVTADPDLSTTVRVMSGPEFGLFTPESHELLWSEAWQITPQSNRMGSRLKGRELQRERPGDMLSSAVIPGTIQVPPSGQPIILMGDAQTTGGYPRIGVVIRADLWKLAQAPLNGHVRLARVDAAAAIDAWAARQRHLDQVAQSLAATGWLVQRHNAAKGVPHAD